MRNDDEPHEVGYGKPPVKHRFEKGRSGNPSGRPKKKQSSGMSIADAVRQELDMTIVVQVNGCKMRLTGREVIAKSVVNKAIKGDTAATRILLGLDSANSNERSKAEAELRDYELSDDLIQQVSEGYLARRALARDQEEKARQEVEKQESKDKETDYDDT